MRTAPYPFINTNQQTAVPSAGIIIRQCRQRKLQKAKKVATATAAPLLAKLAKHIQLADHKPPSNGVATAAHAHDTSTFCQLTSMPAHCSPYPTDSTPALPGTQIHLVGLAFLPSARVRHRQNSGAAAKNGAAAVQTASRFRSVLACPDIAILAGEAGPATAYY